MRRDHQASPLSAGLFVLRQAKAARSNLQPPVDARASPPLERRSATIPSLVWWRFYLGDMATRARTVCRFPGCGALVEQPGYCVRHAKVIAQRTDERRGTAHERGYSKKWQKARETYLQHHPLCVMCEEAGRVT